MSSEISLMSLGSDPFFATGSVYNCPSPPSNVFSPTLLCPIENGLPGLGPPATPTAPTKPDLTIENTQTSNEQQSSSISERGRPRSEKQRNACLLERNRVAANKCRKKKKAYTARLEECFQVAKAKKHNLEMEVDQLHSEVLFLKDQMLKHWHCDNESIRNYLSDMVMQISNRAIFTTPNPPQHNDGAPVLWEYPFQVPRETVDNDSRKASDTSISTVDAIEHVRWDSAMGTINDTSTHLADDSFGDLVDLN
ncbi:hypothetical protein BDV29DRAFT_161807 [Aspergillus leporis]|uniref:BZIP domain-containing protein n=1 Tax=Aspergillus leporis TaxID=41062 RepID=A0A5N5WP52_9EURO|nr:hypothetical protein BDV29DRAFT_161807 [Aspergillus leporis]